MNKLDLSAELQKTYNMTRSEAGLVVDLFFDAIADSLVNGDRVELRGLCSFFVKQYEAYTGRNPMTGEQVMVPAKKLPFFKCGKDLKERMNKS